MTPHSCQQRRPQDSASQSGEKAIRGAIEPEEIVERPQVTVQTSAFVDDFGAMYYEIYEENIGIFFGRTDHIIHVGFTDQSLMNLARLVNRAVCAMLRARGIPVLEWVGQEQFA